MIQVICAKPSIIEGTRDAECAVLYQFLAPQAVCDLTIRSRGNQQLNLEWWSNKQSLISPTRVSKFVSKIQLGLAEHFSVTFVVSQLTSDHRVMQRAGLIACMSH